MRQLKCRHFSIAFLLSSSGSAGAELGRMNPPTNSCGICGCGIITSRRGPKPCFTSLRTPERTFYHSIPKCWTRQGRKINFRASSGTIFSKVAELYQERRFFAENPGNLLHFFKCYGNIYKILFRLRKFDSSGD